MRATITSNLRCFTVYRVNKLEKTQNIDKIGSIKAKKVKEKRGSIQYYRYIIDKRPVYSVHVHSWNTSGVSTWVDPNQLHNSWALPPPQSTSPLSFPDWQSQPPSLHLSPLLSFHFLPSPLLFFSSSLASGQFTPAPPFLFFFGKNDSRYIPPPLLPQIFFPYRDNSTPLKIRKGN